MAPVVTDSAQAEGREVAGDEQEQTPAASVTLPSVGVYALAAAVAAALLPTVFSPSVFSTTFTPKLALLILVGAAGAVPLVRLAISSRVAWAARAALAFLAVSLISALASHAVGIGIFGLYDWGTGWLFWFGCAGAFALGANVEADQLGWVVGGVVFGAGVNSAAAIFQAAAKPTGTFALFDGSQADGMLGNPIHLEALLLGTLALIAGRASVGSSRRLWWPLVVVVSAALELTLERVAVPIMLIIVAGALVVYGVRRAAAFAGLAVAGYAGAYATLGRDLGSRVATSTTTTTYGTRLGIWKLALHAWLHHPFLGMGPGYLIAGLAPHVSESFAEHLGPGVLPSDSHDFFLEVLATTGLLGLLAFVAWVGGAGAKSRGPFLACAMAMLAVELVEPLNVGITPVAILALGAATVVVKGQPVGWRALRLWWRSTAPRGAEASGAAESPQAAAEPEPEPEAAQAQGEPVSSTVAVAGPRAWKPGPAAAVTAVLVVAALFVGTTMIVGDHDMLTTYQQLKPGEKIATAKTANRLLPYWADSAAAVAEGYYWASSFNNAGKQPLEEALAWYAKAVGRFPADPILPADMGALELQLGNREAAQRYYARALQLDPWTFEALEGMGTAARQAGDWRTSLYWYRKALLVAPTYNDLGRLISSDEAHLAGS